MNIKLLKIRDRLDRTIYLNIGNIDYFREIEKDEEHLRIVTTSGNMFDVRKEELGELLDASESKKTSSGC